MNNVITLNTEFQSKNFRDHLLAVYTKTLAYHVCMSDDIDAYILLRSLKKEFNISDDEHDLCDELTLTCNESSLDRVRIAIAEIENDLFDSMTSDNQDEMYSRMCEIITLRTMYDTVYKRKEPLEITQSFKISPDMTM